MSHSHVTPDVLPYIVVVSTDNCSFTNNNNTNLHTFVVAQEHDGEQSSEKFGVVRF